MGDLFVKDFPEDLHRELKIKAASEGKSLKQVIIELCWQGLKQSLPSKFKQKGGVKRD